MHTTGTSKARVESVSEPDAPKSFEERARFEDLLEFPTAFTFRVVAAALPRVARDATASLERMTGTTASVLSTQPSRTGKWSVYRIGTTVASADQIRAAYDMLAKIDGVRMVL
jgi:putative lipoic acid-binding regulatory protein